ncbi:uncharacterized protein LOC106076492 isoform X2 [Biomphalaria glabrata]|uniref:Uncharacterized protein LOC106076492 isoform X2 n=1 Tax=Biomphalaria glabrata TaxID=6526 RepID=A0A9W2Z6A9_BIOGL|nr:uncharacterized protein LOC106076492 isoform X2 [Biomphalaria glabrata]
MNTGEDGVDISPKPLAKGMPLEPSLPTIKSNTKSEAHAHSVHFAIEGTERVMVQKISMFEPNIGISQALISPTASEVEFVLTNPWTGYVRKAASSPTQLIRFGPPVTRKRSTSEEDPKRKKSILTNKTSGIKKETDQPIDESAKEGSTTSLLSSFSKSAFDPRGLHKGTEEGREKKKSRKKVKVESKIAAEDKKLDLKDEKVEEKMTMTHKTVVEGEFVEDKKIRDADSKETVEVKNKIPKQETSKDSLASQSDKVKKKRLKSQDVDLPSADSLTSQSDKGKKKRLKSQDVDLPSEETHHIKEHARKRRTSDEEKEQTKSLETRLRDLLTPFGQVDPRRSLGADLREAGPRKSRDEGRSRLGRPSIDGGRSRKCSRDERPRKSINRGWILNRAALQRKGKSFMSRTQISNESSPSGSQRRIRAKSKDDGSNKGDKTFGSEYSSSQKRFSLTTKKKKSLKQPKPKRFLLPEIPGVTYNRSKFVGWDFGTKRRPTIAVNLPDITDTAPDVIDTILSKSTDPAYDLLFRSRADSLYSDPRTQNLLDGLDPSMRPPEALETYPGFYAVAKSASKYKRERKGKAWNKSFIEPLKDFEPILKIRDEQNVLVQNPADLSGTTTPLTQETLSSFDMGISRQISPALLAIDKLSGKRKPKPAKDISKSPAPRPKLSSSPSQETQRFEAEKSSTVKEAAKVRKRAPSSYLGMADDGVDTLIPQDSDTSIAPKSIKVKDLHITPGQPERKKQNAMQIELLSSKLETSEESIPEMSQTSKEKGATARTTSASVDKIKRPKVVQHRRASMAPGVFEDLKADIDVEGPSLKKIDAHAKHLKPEISEDSEAEIDVEEPFLTKINAHAKHHIPEVSEDSETDINVRQPTFETNDARSEHRKPENSVDSVADINVEVPSFAKTDERAKYSKQFYEISEDSLIGTGFDKISKKRIPPSLKMQPETPETIRKSGKKRTTLASLSSPKSSKKPHIIITEDTEFLDGQESLPSSSDVSITDEAFKERTLQEMDVSLFQNLLKSDIDEMSQSFVSTTTSSMSSDKASIVLLAPPRADAFPKLVSEELIWEDKLGVSQSSERTQSQDTMQSPETTQYSNVVPKFDQFSENLQETCIHFFNVTKPELVSQKYISEHGIEELLSFLMYAIVMHKPQDPVDFIISLARSINRLVKLKQLSDRKIRQGRAFRIARLGDHLASPPKSQTDILGLTSEYLSPRHPN